MGILPATVGTGFTGEEISKLGLKVYVGVCQAEKEVIRYSRQRDKTAISNMTLATQENTLENGSLRITISTLMTSFL